MKTITLTIIFILFLLLTTAYAQDEDFSPFIESKNTLIQFYEEPRIWLEINYNGYITVIDSADRKLIIDFASDTIKCEGFVLDSHAETFCRAVIYAMQNSYEGEWRRLSYLENKYGEYRAALEPKYQKALELYLQQEFGEPEK